MHRRSLLLTPLVFLTPLGRYQRKHQLRELVEDSEAVPFTATAYSLRGTTKDGSEARPGTVAADPDVLPLGSRIRVLDAGDYSGHYTVVDTGAKVRGRRIDIFIPSQVDARTFGRQKVAVQILELAGESNVGI